MNGIPYNLFSPKGVATRAQAATVPLRSVEALGMIDK